MFLLIHWCWTWCWLRPVSTRRAAFLYNIITTCKSFVCMAYHLSLHLKDSKASYFLRIKAVTWEGCLERSEMAGEHRIHRARPDPSSRRMRTDWLGVPSQGQNTVHHCDLDLTMHVLVVHVIGGLNRVEWARSILLGSSCSLDPKP